MNPCLTWLPCYITLSFSSENGTENCWYSHYSPPQTSSVNPRLSWLPCYSHSVEFLLKDWKLQTDAGVNITILHRIIQWIPVWPDYPISSPRLELAERCWCEHYPPPQKPTVNPCLTCLPCYSHCVKFLLENWNLQRNVGVNATLLHRILQ